MKTTNLLLLATIGFAILDWSKNWIAEKFSIIDSRLRFRLINPKGIGSDLTVSIQNNTSIPVFIDSMQVSIFYRNEYLGSANFSNPVEIKPVSVSEITFDVFIEFFGLSESFKQAIKTGVLSELTLTGNVQSGGISIPFEKNISIV